MARFSKLRRKQKARRRRIRLLERAKSLLTAKDGTDRFAVPISKSLDDFLVFPFCRFKRDGEWREFTRQMGEEMVRNFDAGVIERDVPVNSEHERWRGRIGKLSRLWVADDGVRGAIEPDEGRDLSAFRYVSPEIKWEWTHPYEGGDHRNVLMGLAGTNYPFLLGRTSLWSEVAKSWEGADGVASLRDAALAGDRAAIGALCSIAPDGALLQAREILNELKEA